MPSHTPKERLKVRTRKLLAAGPVRGITPAVTRQGRRQLAKKLIKIRRKQGRQAAVKFQLQEK